ncbi:AMP-binding protein, partial [Maribacter sp. 2-571]|uniref:AMP-binding protein n=1 Tax=Maribacter sp. 2-571 TaxID=3417569 RepID=UPI003D34CCD8
HQSAPFEKVVDRVVKTRDMSMPPLFQVMFALQNTIGEEDDSSASDAPFEVSSYEEDGGTAKFDLLLSAVEDPSGISLELEYCTDLFDSVTIDRMLSHYRELLRSIVANPVSRITSLSMLTSPEEEQLLGAFNDTAREYPGERTILELFREQVGDSPENTALVLGDNALSYSEVDLCSSKLAHYLQSEHGVLPGDHIGLLLDRSPLAIISMLGIMKCGGVYVPIDKGYPEERKSLILEDAGARLLVT